MATLLENIKVMTEAAKDIASQTGEADRKKYIDEVTIAYLELRDVVLSMTSEETMIMSKFKFEEQELGHKVGRKFLESMVDAFSDKFSKEYGFNKKTVLGLVEAENRYRHLFVFDGYDGFYTTGFYSLVPKK